MAPGWKADLFAVTLFLSLSIVWSRPGPHEDVSQHPIGGTSQRPAQPFWKNGVGKLPPMGFNTWNRFYCDIHETLMRDTATQMKALGFLDAGYEYINLDDCWLKEDRSGDGHLVVDDQKFPSGLNNLTDFLHDLGFKAGIYQDLGSKTCAGFAGSLGHEVTDARDFVRWGFDYAKIDNCWHDGYEGTNESRFKRWHDALVRVHRETGKWLFYSFVEWQSFDAWIWGPKIANAWRSKWRSNTLWGKANEMNGFAVYDDIEATWDSIKVILNNASFIGDYSNFYGHNDLDMLENGNGELSLEEQRSHFTAWALTKSPLLIGTDISQLTPGSMEILLNKEIIAINQDANIGEPLKPFLWGKNADYTWDPEFPAQYWSGYYMDERHTAVMYLNFYEEAADVNFRLAQSPHLKEGRRYAVRDLWRHEEMGVVEGQFFESNITRHDVRVYVFTEMM